MPDDADRGYGAAAPVICVSACDRLASQSGVRVGRSVFASTVPCAVQPSAIAVAVSLDHVLEAEARAARVEAARVDEQPVVEDRGREEAGVRLEHERLDPLVAQPLVAAGVALEELDAGDLEPDEVVRVVRDALRVGLGEAHADRGGEVEALHGRDSLRRRRQRELELRMVGQPGDADPDEAQRPGPVAQRPVEERARRARRCGGRRRSRRSSDVERVRIAKSG